MKKSVVQDKVYSERLHSNIERDSDFFPNQRDGEKVKMCVRSHWLREIHIFLHFILLGIIFPIIFIYLLQILRSGNVDWRYIHVFLSGYLAAVWLHMFAEFIKSELTVIIVTNERVVNLTQHGLFNRQISEISLNRIQEVTGFSSGFIANLFDIGKLEIQSSSVEIPLIMKFVKSPHLTSRKILDVQRFASLQRRSSDFGARSSDRLKPRKDENFTPEELMLMRGEERQQASLLQRDGENNDGIN